MTRTDAGLLGNGGPTASPSGLALQILRAALDSLSDKIAVIDSAGRIVFANQAWHADAADQLGLCRRGPGESFLVGIEQSVLRGADALRLRRAIREVLTGKRGHFFYECRMRTAATRAWFSIDVTSFELGDGVHARIALAEITNGKVAERSRIASEQKARRTRKKIVGHERLIRRLRESERLKDEFIATLAHELRNPLAPILNAAELLVAARADQQAAVRACDVIRRQTRMLTRLVDDLLDISRIVRGNLELRREPVDLRSVIATAIETASPLLDKQRHTLTVRMRKQPLIVAGDAARLGQIVANLLNNAAKYTNANGRITLVAARVSNAAVVRIRDTGIGIAREQLARIFDWFAQAEPRSKRSLGGLGVGLALARQLAERHGGALTVYSDGLGRGSAFTLALPMDTGGPRESAAVAPARERVHGARRRILIVEDDADTADSMAALLRLWGHEVAIARDGSVAVIEALTLRPDVILIDLGLATVSGYEVAQMVSRNPDTAAIPLISLSGFGGDEDRERSVRAGFCMHLVKPVEPAVLSDVLLRDRALPRGASIH